MEAILSTILGYASQAVLAVPAVEGVVSIVESAVNAFKTGDQAALDAAHAQMTALANADAPPGVTV